MLVPLNLNSSNTVYCYNDDVTNLRMDSVLGFSDAEARLKNTGTEQIDVTIGDTDTGFNGLRYNATTNWYIAQMFVPRYNAEYHRIDLRMFKNNNPTGNMTLKIREFGSGATSLDPNGGIILATSDAVAQSSAGAGIDWITFTFSTPPLLEANKAYLAVLEADTTNSVTNYVAWEYDATAMVYNRSSWLGSNVPVWALQAVEHQLRIVYKQFPVSAEELYVRLDGGSDGGDWNMGDIADTEDLGAIGYKYFASDTEYDLLVGGDRTTIDGLVSGSYLTLANLRLEGDPAGRYHYLKLQFNRSSATVGSRIAGSGFWIEYTPTTGGGETNFASVA